MTDLNPNPQQEAFIDAADGIYVIDAGAGTGKTFAVTERYVGLLAENEIEPEDILLVTFTNNAATEMKERVVARGDYAMSALRDAPITTFHGWCHEFLTSHGLTAPMHLGLDERITTATDVLENEIIEADRFEEFLRTFVDAHPEHHAIYRVLWDPGNLLNLIKALAAKGVFPTADGWYRDCERYLDGDFDAFEQLFAVANALNEGANGPTQSDLRASLNGFESNHCLTPDAPSVDDIRGDGSKKRIDPGWASEAFEEDRTALKAFVHDVYVEYLTFCLRRNYLNFAFLQLFAYVLLCEDHDLRESVQYSHVMVDEFQDTSEIQFKLALLLCAEGNLCVVGDWKQSIFSFQYASVDNIRQFDRRLHRYADELNVDYERIDFPVDNVTTLPLTVNYRSTQAILECAEQCLALPGKQDESVDIPDIISLEAHTDRANSVIEAYTCTEEVDGVLDRIQHIVGNDRFAVEDAEGTLRPPTYDDIAVITRKRKFGRDLQGRANDLGIPVAYEGGVDLFETAHAIVLLAWLRVLEDARSRRGWAVILEEAGYTFEEIAYRLDHNHLPADMLDFRDHLLGHESVIAVARAVLNRYGFDDPYADALIGALQGAFDETLGNRGDLIEYIVKCIEGEVTREVSDTPGGDAVTVQTMHAAKGLQHPIVIVPDINAHSFPSRGGGFSSAIRYADPIGLRQTKLYLEDDRPHLYDNWRYRILNACIRGEYDEERRLFYVAMTRAEHHLIMMAGDDPSPFFEQLDLEPIAIEPDIQPIDADTSSDQPFTFDFPLRAMPIALSPHAIMDEDVYGEALAGRGKAFGNEVHDFAEQYADAGDLSDFDPDDEHPDKAHVRRFIDGLPGALRVEEQAYLPIEVDGQQLIFSGVIDLLHVHKGTVDVIDYKTDIDHRAEGEYRKQLSVYYHAVANVYDDHEVRASLFYTYTDEREVIEPLSLEGIKAMTKATQLNQNSED